MKKISLVLIMILSLLSVSFIVLNSEYGFAVSDTSSKDLSISVVNQDPDPAVAGNTFDLRLGVENLRTSSVNDVVLEIIPSYPFEQVSSESLTQDLGSMGAYQSGSDNKIVKYTLKVNKDATQGTYDLNVKYSFSGITAFSVTKTVSVNVRGSQSIEIVHIDKTILIPGKQSSLKFVINNVGTSPLKDLTFSWTNDAKIILPVGSDNTKYVSYLDVGESAEVEYQVIADTSVDAGLYPLNLVLKYSGSSTNITTINTIAGVYVGGSTDFDVAFSDSSSGTTSFTVANIGSNPATSVSVIIPDQKGWKISGSNAIIIGNLNKGDYTVASFKLQSVATNLMNRTNRINNTNLNIANGVATSDNNLANSADNVNVGVDNIMMQIAYTDTMGIRTIVNKTIKIGMQNLGTNQTMAGNYNRTMTTKSSGISTTWYIVGAVVLIIGIFVYRRYAKRKILDSSTNKDKKNK
jgi:hypothetical protein